MATDLEQDELLPPDLGGRRMLPFIVEALCEILVREEAAAARGLRKVLDPPPFAETDLLPARAPRDRQQALPIDPATRLGDRREKMERRYLQE